ncbi:MAG: hypothetical protein M3237_23500, partial [Actinomycetota bacterium]|nr:hypothetical protein [Actinomycetota bacterium]
MSLKDGPPVPLAILTTPSFDARTVDPATVCFGDPNNATQRDCSESHGTGHSEDVDRDRDVDLVLHFDINQLGLDQDDTTACLTGRTRSGTAIYACDAVAVTNALQEAELPNLEIALVAEPSAADAHDAVRWTATVTNSGIGAITLGPGSDVLTLQVPDSLSGVAAAGPPGSSCADTSPGVLTCRTDEPDTILVGGTRVFTLDAVLPSVPGPVEVQADVDPSGIVTELNEADNTAEAASVVHARNLRVALVVHPPAVSPEDDILWRATVHNDGPGAAPIGSGTVVVRFTVPSGLTNIGFSPPAGFSCAGAGPNTYDCAATEPAELAAGSATVFELSAQAPSAAGGIALTGVADPSDVVVESDETDNEATVDALVQNPNLIAALTVTPQDPGSGEQVEWVVRVTNAGPTRVRMPAGAPLLAFSYTPDLAGTTMTGPPGYTCAGPTARSFRCTTAALDVIGVGGDRLFRFTATAPAGGDIDVAATVDPDGRVGEADETDNTVTGSTSVVVRQPDLTIAVTGSPDPVDAAATATWVARISNPSAVPVTVPSGTTLIRFVHPSAMLNLFASTPAGYSCFISAPLTVDCATTTEQTIAPGSFVDMTLGGTAPRPPGPITVTTTADPVNVVTETDENNNQASATITVQPPDLSITLTGSPDPVDALAQSTWVARITNDGPANARISNSMRPIRFLIPDGMVNLAVSSPSGYTCFIEAPQTVDCQATATQ